MKKRTPRGPVPSLIGGSNGRPQRVKVGKKSCCSRCHCEFSKGDTCISIPKLGGSFVGRRRVCDECYRGILKKTRVDLNEVSAL